MPNPRTRDQLVEDGYKFDNHAKCSGEDCRRDIEWWLTKNGKKIPYDLMPESISPAVPHWTTCPNAEDFRRKRAH